MSYIKRLFKKELDSILASLEKIHIDLDNIIDRASTAISTNLHKISLLQIKNQAKQIEQEEASKVKENLKALLGKL